MTITGTVGLFHHSETSLVASKMLWDTPPTTTPWVGKKFYENRLAMHYYIVVVVVVVVDDDDDDDDVCC